MITLQTILMVLTPSYTLINGLDNGVAQTPPMGWSTWEVFGCNTQCDNSIYTYNNCLNQFNIENTADALVNLGYSQLGYQYIIIDDCWQDNERDKVTGNLQPDFKRFPNGMRYLADYLHSRNLKLGLFSDLGEKTGQGYPGSQNNLSKDAFTFTEWQVDYVKMSGAGIDARKMDNDYPEFGSYLKKFSPNRPILLATSWPVYQEFNNLQINYKAVQRNCNTWRFSSDMGRNWDTILSIMDDYVKKQDVYTLMAQHGAWNDADLLTIGHAGITIDQSKAQIAVWSIMAAPLFISTNIRNLTDEQKAILQNRDVINVHQDALAIAGYRISSKNMIDTWIRPITPNTDYNYSYAIAFVNRNKYGSPVTHTISFNDLKLNNGNPELKYHITDLFPARNSYAYSRTMMYSTTTLQAQINPSGVAFFKAELIIPTTETKTFTFPYNSNNNIIRLSRL